MPTPHRAPHKPNYTLRRVGNRLIRCCWTCQKAAKRRWNEKNVEKVLRIRRASGKRCRLAKENG